ncbi:MAG: LytTR family transcriptional regulator, partial [Lachnospiraceae bacterium]|nr:LytTR family transcriptional regulator [Lachnospiraceae bacterium]
MKITIMDVPDGEEDEIIVRCRHIDKQLLKLIYAVRAGQEKILALRGNEYIQISPEKIYYFE